ncbi:MAG: hypothetical protein GC137_06080 [Alphaproteobacteria bacterium]|nr:hypothetical protein [Alphaproteobacteria bacterium]
MTKKKIKEELEIYAASGSEVEDITKAMTDDAEFARSWLHDFIIQQNTKKNGNKRFSAEERILMKVKSYKAYIQLSMTIQASMEATANKLLSEQ